MRIDAGEQMSAVWVEEGIRVTRVGRFLRSAQLNLE